jgi:hypothetical protein
MIVERTIEWVLSIPLILLIIPFALWATHISMVKDDDGVKRLKYATFREIKEKMKTTKWIFDKFYPSSLFALNRSEAQFHAGIFAFNETGYLLTPFGYFMASAYQRKIRKTLPRYDEWDKPVVK